MSYRYVTTGWHTKNHDAPDLTARKRQGVERIPGRGRSSRAKPKIPFETVKEMREAYEGGGFTIKSIATMYGLNYMTVKNILQYITRVNG